MFHLHNNLPVIFQLIQELKKENFDLKLRLYMEQKEREVGRLLARCNLHKSIQSIFHYSGLQNRD